MPKKTVLKDPSKKPTRVNFDASPRDLEIFDQNIEIGGFATQAEMHRMAARVLREVLDCMQHGGKTHKVIPGKPVEILILPIFVKRIPLPDTPA